MGKRRSFSKAELAKTVTEAIDPKHPNHDREFTATLFRMRPDWFTSKDIDALAKVYPDWFKR